MNSSSNSNELRDFLLDRLPQEKAEAIEERMFQDEAFFSDLQDAEDELIEEFVTGEMDSAEAKLFAVRIERDSDLRERVAVRRALIRALQQTSSQVAVAAAAAPSPARRGLWGRFLVPGFALALLILFFLSYKAEHRSGLPSQAVGTPPAPSQGSMGSRQNAVSQTAAVLFLPAHVARGAAQQRSVLHLGNAAAVKLELETPSADASMRWNVRVTNGGTVFSASGLKSQQAGVVSYVVAEVPASQLSPKAYQVTLSPEGSSEGAVSTSWDFQVVK